MCAEPGMIPIRKPSTLPRPIGPTEALSSAPVGTSSRSFGCRTATSRAFAALRMISEMPKSPTATGTMPSPSRIAITSPVKRA